MNPTCLKKKKKPTCQKKKSISLDIKHSDYGKSTERVIPSSPTKAHTQISFWGERTMNSLK